MHTLGNNTEKYIEYTHINPVKNTMTNDAEQLIEYGLRELTD